MSTCKSCVALERYRNGKQNKYVGAKKPSQMLFQNVTNNKRPMSNSMNFAHD